MTSPGTSAPCATSVPSATSARPPGTTGRATRAPGAPPTGSPTASRIATVTVNANVIGTCPVALVSGFFIYMYIVFITYKVIKRNVI